MNDKLQALLAQALSTSANAILITDRKGRIIWVNAAFSRLSGYHKDELIGHTPNLLRSGAQSAEFYRVLWQTILAGHAWQGELVDRRKDGSLYTVHQVITPLLDEGGAARYFISIQHDITEQTQEREKIHRLAFHDCLTGLPNRALFLDVLDQAIIHAQEEHELFAVMFLDLDRFKEINDLHGHAIGDSLLIAVSERLSAAVRKADVVARFGGDEFAVLVNKLSQIEEAGRIAGKLVKAIGQPFLLNHSTLRTSTSIGISLAPRDGASAALLLSRADHAMYRVKAHGGGNYAYWSRLPPLPL